MDSPRDVLGDWQVLPLQSVASHVTDGTHMPPPRSEKGVPLLSAKDVSDGQVFISESRFVSREFYESELSRTQLAPGDVLVTIVGSIGRSSVVPDNFEAAFQRSVA